MRSSSGARQPRAVGRHGRRRAGAGADRAAEVAARAGVQRGDQHEVGRVGDAAADAHDRDGAVLERLAQRLQHAARELEQLVEEQDAVVRERDLAGAHRRARRRPAPPPTPCGGARGTGARRPAPSRRAARRSNRPSSSPAPRRSASGGRIPGRRWASIVLPEPGGPTNSRLWPPAAAISSARRGTSCPRTSARSASGTSGAVAAPARPAGDGRRHGSPRSRATSAPRLRRRLHLVAADRPPPRRRSRAGRRAAARRVRAPRRRSAARRAPGAACRRAPARRRTACRRAPPRRRRPPRRASRRRSARRTRRRPCAGRPAPG